MKVRSISPETLAEMRPSALRTIPARSPAPPCSTVGAPNSRYEMISVCDSCCFSADSVSFGCSSEPPMCATTLMSSDAERPWVDTACTTCFASMSSPASRSGVPK